MRSALQSTGLTTLGLMSAVTLYLGYRYGLFAFIPASALAYSMVITLILFSALFWLQRSRTRSQSRADCSATPSDCAATEKTCPTSHEALARATRKDAATSESSNETDWITPATGITLAFIMTLDRVFRPTPTPRWYLWAMLTFVLIGLFILHWRLWLYIRRAVVRVQRWRRSMGAGQSKI